MLQPSYYRLLKYWNFTWSQSHWILDRSTFILEIEMRGRIIWMQISWMKLSFKGSVNIIIVATWSSFEKKEVKVYKIVV